MDVSLFTNPDMGELVDISGTESTGRAWAHKAFIPAPLPSSTPDIQGRTYRVVADARAAVAALDSTARQLPNPTLLRRPTLQQEAQSTSALEGTYAPLEKVLIADDENPTTRELAEILNYVHMADEGIAWIVDGRPITAGMLSDLQGTLMKGTDLESASGQPRDIQVVVGQRTEADTSAPMVEQARFVPTPPGDQLQAGLEALAAWTMEDHSEQIDPIVAVAMTHYQFETLTPSGTETAGWGVTSSCFISCSLGRSASRPCQCPLGSRRDALPTMTLSSASALGETGTPTSRSSQKESRSLRTERYGRCWPWLRSRSPCVKSSESPRSAQRQRSPSWITLLPTPPSPSTPQLMLWTCRRTMRGKPSGNSPSWGSWSRSTPVPIAAGTSLRRS